MTASFPVCGNVPAVVTPFDEGDAVDYGQFARLVRWHIRQGADGICVAGDNGEAWALSIDTWRSWETAVAVPNANLSSLGGLRYHLGRFLTVSRLGGGTSDAALGAE